MVTPRREPHVVSQVVGDELVLHDVQSGQAHVLGPATAAVWRCCDGRMTARQVARMIGVDENDVVAEVSRLQDAGVLVTGLSRRRLLQLGGGAVLAAPVLSVALPMASAAASPTVPVSYRDSVLSSSPVAYFRLADAEGSTVLADSSTYDRNGDYRTISPYQTAPRATGSTQPGATSDGDVAFLADTSYGSLSNVLAAATAFSLEFWVQTTTSAGVANDPWYRGKGLVDGETSGQVKDFGTSVVAQTIAFGVGGSDVTIHGATTVTDGVYHHVVATWASGVEMVLYVDGVLDASTTTGVPVGPRSDSPAIAIGTTRSTDQGYSFATLDEVAIYDRELSLAEVRMHFQSR